jgi:hypothetical protein
MMDEIEEETVGTACSTHGEDEECIQNYSWKTSREDITSDSQLWVGG